MRQRNACLPPCSAMGAKMSSGNGKQPVVLAYTVRQCVTCRRVLSWPIYTMTDAFKYSYRHCGSAPTEFIEIAPKRERGHAVCEVVE